MKRSILCVAALAGLLAIPACVRIGRGSPPNLVPKTGLNRGAVSDENRPLVDGLGLKPVHGKEEPATLLARDGTSCTVSKKKFDSTRLGTSAWCAWTEKSR